MFLQQSIYLIKLLLWAFIGLHLTMNPTWSLSDERLCADPKCENIISIGSAKLTYSAPAEGMLSFKINTPMRILSKSAGKDPKLWGVEVNGRFGYVNKDFIQEKKVMIKDADLKYTVPVKQIVPDSKKQSNEEVSISKADELSKESVLLTNNTTNTTDMTNNLNDTKPEQQLNTESINSELNTPNQEVLTPNLKSDQVVSPLNLKNTSTNLDETSNSNEIKISSIDQHSHSTETSDNTSDQLLPNKVEIQSMKPVVLSASEIQAEVLTTTTSPLNVIDNVIKTSKLDNMPSATGDTSTTMLPVASNVLLVDGTHLTVEDATLTNDLVTSEKISKEEKVVDSDIKKDTEIKTNSINSKEISDNRIEETSEKANLLSATESKNEAKINSENGLNSENILNDLKSEENENSTKEDSFEIHNKNHINTETKKDSIDVNKNLLNNEENEKVTKVIDTDKVHSAYNSFESSPDITVKQFDSNKSPDQDIITPNINHINNKEALIPETEPIKEEKLNIFPKISEVKEHGKHETIKEDSFNVFPKIDEVKEHEPIKEERLNVFPKIPEVKEHAKHEPIKEEKLNVLPKIAEIKEHIKHEPIKEERLNVFPKIDEVKEHEKHEPIKEEKLNIFPKISEFKEHKKDTHGIDYSSSSAEASQHEQDNENFGFTSSHSITPPPNDNFDQIIVPQNVGNEEMQTIYNEDSVVSDLKLTSTESSNIYHTESIRQTNAHELTSSQGIEYSRTTPSQIPINEDANTHNSVSKQESNIDLNWTNDLLLDEQKDESSPIPDSNQHDTETFESENTIPFNNDPVMLPSTVTPSNEKDTIKEAESLFGAIVGTVNSFLSIEKSDTRMKEIFSEAELDRILFSDCKHDSNKDKQYCEKQDYSSMDSSNDFIKILSIKIIENIQFVLCVAIAASCTLLFTFGYYCFCSGSQDGSLLNKLNRLERSLLATHKENEILKHDLTAMSTKLSNIENNSFGSNDMVISIKKQLDEELEEKSKLLEQVNSLEKELEDAAEAGLELNKIVSELLANRNGDQSIISSVEELQQQLNDQEKTIMEINANLAEKSRENTELQIAIAEQNSRLTSKLTSLQQDNDELEVEKANLQTSIEQMKDDFENELKRALEGKNYEIMKLQHQITEISAKMEAEHSDLQQSLAKIEAFEECIKTIKKGTNVNAGDVIALANVRGELMDLQKKYSALKTRYNNELETKAMVECQLRDASHEIEKLKKDYNQSEKDKLEAQTRLEVLSNYFKEKEAQLQKELSLKEAMWLKQQGENTGTVERLTNMQEEIQNLKSQNDALRAEVEAQIASHKVQIGTLENRAHESWLAARQSERRFNEARAEATSLRQKLTAIAGGKDLSLNAATPNSKVSENNLDINNVPSPIPLELPELPGPLPFLPPPPFLGSPHFMGLAAPPFLPPGDIRPPPLGRMKSPIPGSIGRFSPYYRDELSDYDEEYDDEEYDERPRRRCGSWKRNTYSPTSRTFRSLSPSESQYKFDDTETDYSPPITPRRSRNGRPNYKVPSNHVNEV